MSRIQLYVRDQLIDEVEFKLKNYDNAGIKAKYYLHKKQINEILSNMINSRSKLIAKYLDKVQFVLVLDSSMNYLMPIR